MVSEDSTCTRTGQAEPASQTVLRRNIPTSRVIILPVRLEIDVVR